MAKTSLDVFSLSREQVWTFSVLGERMGYILLCSCILRLTKQERLSAIKHQILLTILDIPGSLRLHTTVLLAKRVGSLVECLHGAFIRNSRKGLSTSSTTVSLRVCSM